MVGRNAGENLVGSTPWPRARGALIRIGRHGASVGSFTILAMVLQVVTPAIAWAQSADGQPTDRAAELKELKAASSEKPSAAAIDAAGALLGSATAGDQAARVTGAKDTARDALSEKGKPGADGPAPRRPQEPLPEDQEETNRAAAVVAPGASADKSGASSQAISVPKGSGTIEGMGESFSAQLSTGVATFTVPFSLPAARGAAQPSLGLVYSSGSGWGAAGTGWDVGVQFIARQTDRGPPRYDDRDDWHPEQDRFVFNGGQELVPICKVGATAPSALTCSGALAGEQMPPWSLGSQYFRPRVEGSFLRFFWSPNHQTWRVQDKTGLTMELGVPLESSGDRSGIETSPYDPSRISRWALVRHYDTQGGANPTSATTNPTPVNVVIYRYDALNGPGVLLTDIYDTPPAANPTTSDLSLYAHHTRLRYEKRPDLSTSCRMGFEIEREHRLVGVDVSSTTFNFGTTRKRQHLRRYHLNYAANRNTSLLQSVQVEGRCGGSEDNVTHAPSEGLDGSLPVSSCPRLPAMTFEYTHVEPFNSNGEATEPPLPGFEGFDERVRDILGSPDRSVEDSQSDFFDLNHDALPDFMVTQPGVYGSGFGQFLNAPGGVADSFSPAANLPVFGVDGATAGSLRLSNANIAALDLDGDARVNLLHASAAKKYAAYVLDSTGITGRSVTTANDQNLKVDFGRDALTTKVLDVNGDGLVDVVVTTGTEIQTFFALGREPGGKDQFGTATRTGPKTADISNDPVRACLPWSSTAVSFGDKEIQLADMNGDGLQDIVRLQRGKLRYWPGRGNGMWGTGSLEGCTANTFAASTDVVMAASPIFSDLNGSSLRLDDINGDGLDDLVEIQTNSVDVWLNVNGKSWTHRHIIQGTPSNPSFVNRVRLLDINGSGTRDIVWGGAGKFQYMDLQGGKRPWLLSRIANGLGKTTAIEYSTSTAEMMAADQLGGACTSDTWTGPWCSKMEIVTHVVKRVTESDNLVFASSAPNIIVTEYEYRDPRYDGVQKEFRGFRRGRTKKIGDAHSPTSYTESQFLLGACAADSPSESYDCTDLAGDNPREALKGLPVVTETYSETGIYLSTEATAHRLRRLYVGRDGREVRHAFQVATRKTLYDTFLGAPTGATTGPFNGIEIEKTIDATFNPITNPTGLPLGLVSESVLIPLRSTTGTAVIESRSQFDYFGNQQVAAALGCTSGPACPTAMTGVDANEAIYAFTIPGRPSGDETGWLFRTVEAYKKGSVRAQVRGRTLTTYNSKGSPIQTQADLQGTVALDRRHRTLTGSSVVASAPTGASTDGLKVVSTQIYDGFGNVTQATAPNGRCRATSYDAAATGYSQLVTSETLYTTAGCTGSSLTTAAAYDRALSKATVITDSSLQATTVAYDPFGRLSGLVRPRPSGTGTPQSSMTLLYSLPTADRPYSTIETRSQDSPTVDGTTYIWSVAFVDGMGRTRLQRLEADPAGGRDAGSAIHDGVVAYDAKGAVARKYLAQFATATATDPLPATVSGPFGRMEYDAFGRTLRSFDLDTGLAGVQTVRNDYHALSQDSWDAADLGLDVGQAHQGTFATQRNDGHGRTIVTTERVFEGGVLDLRDVRTKYLTTGEPEMITRVHVGSADPPVLRWMRYDTMGRLVLNVEPHTTFNFNPDPNTNATPSTNGLRAWRYAYNDAGDVVGTSDARGCGTNYTYDASGRITSEDYSPCEAAHAAYSAPNFGTHAGIEVFYQYDSIPTSFSTVIGVPSGSGGSGIPAGYDASSLNLKGRLAAIYDRSGLQVFTFDNRGGGIRLDRRMADPNPAVVDPRLRYRGRWYTITSAYDSADRVVSQSTGAVSPELLIASNSQLQAEYSGRGSIKRIYGSYGDLVASTKLSADGLLEEVVYGDAASTTAVQTYNARRWLATSLVSRAVPSLWSSPPANYLPAPNLAGPPSTFQMILRDESFTYDIVGNPSAITDFRTTSEWPAGAKPASRTIQYDDLYRVKQVDYTYAGGGDAFVSAFAPERAGSSDPRQSNNFPTHLLPSQRIKLQTYQYDWLGSPKSADDDVHAMWDRGVGPTTNHAATGMPYRWKNAGDLANPSWVGSGTAEALAYDEAGNLLDLQTTKVGTCTNGAGSCTVRFTYSYDEVGRLNKGVRIEGGLTVADLRFVYDNSDNRIVKADYSAAQPNFSVQVFGTLELRRASYDSTAGDYAQNATTETPILAIGGQGVGRLTYEGAADGEPRIVGNRLHVLLNIGDHLGSSSIVVDRDTGELAERRTYLAYGATESDYRPDRWKGFREDYGFTGKEEDIEIGLQYFGKRFLSPYLGIWTSPDPLAVHKPGQADLNLYAYVKGAVLRSVDPLGLDKVMIVAGNADPNNDDEAGDAHLKTFAGQWKNATTEKLKDGRIIRTELEPGRRHVVTVDKNASASQMKAKMKEAADLAGKDGKVILAVGHGAAGDGQKGGMLDLAPNAKDTPLRLKADDLEFAETARTQKVGPRITGAENEATTLLGEWGDSLRSAGASLELLTCKIGADKGTFMKNLADRTGVKVEAHKMKVGIRGVDPASTMEMTEGKRVIEGTESTTNTPAPDATQKPSADAKGAKPAPAPAKK